MVAMLAAAVTLGAACSSSHSKSHPASTTSTTSSSAPTTSIVTTTSTSTSVPPTSAPATTVPVSTLSGPTIVSFTGPGSPIQCYARDTSVELRWETRNATRVTLSINGGGVFASYANGKRSQLEPLTCDGTNQTYTLTARGANGTSITKSLTLTERAST